MQIRKTQKRKTEKRLQKRKMWKRKTQKRKTQIIYYNSYQKILEKHKQKTIKNVDNNNSFLATKKYKVIKII